MESNDRSTGGFGFHIPTRVTVFGAFLLVCAIVVLQNLEPTRIDILFWSLPDVPKLVALLAAMATGAVLAELGRALFFTRRRDRR